MLLLSSPRRLIDKVTCLIFHKFTPWTWNTCWNPPDFNKNAYLRIDVQCTIAPGHNRMGSSPVQVPGFRAPNWYTASICKLNCTMSKLTSRAMVLSSLGTPPTNWLLSLWAGADLHPAHRGWATWVCSHPRRFAPKEMKIQDISFTLLFSANSFHTQNWIKYFSVKHEYAYSNISMQDHDTHGEHVRKPVEIFCADFLTVFQIHKPKAIRNKNFSSGALISAVLDSKIFQHCVTYIEQMKMKLKWRILSSFLL